MTNTSFLLLACGWIVWCAFHSLLISPAVSRYLQSMLGSLQLYFRMLYNVFAFLTLLPVMAATATMRGDVVFSWQGGWVVVRIVLVVLSLWLFRDGAKHYDIGIMLGIRQIRLRRHQLLLAAEGHFSRQGSLGITRHPWYLGSLLLLWSILPVYYQSSVVAATVLSVYLVIGTWLEERKLVGEYGEKYRSYQREVSMFIPFKWYRKKIMRGK